MKKKIYPTVEQAENRWIEAIRKVKHSIGHDRELALDEYKVADREYRFALAKKNHLVQNRKVIL